MPLWVMSLDCKEMDATERLCTGCVHPCYTHRMTTHQPHAASAKPVRRTNIKTFRLFRDQISYIERENGDCSSFFMRFLMDAWMDNKIPHAVKLEFFSLRAELRKKADMEKLKQIVREGQRPESDSNNAEIR